MPFSRSRLGGFRQLRGDDGYRGKIDILPGEIREALRKTTGGVDFPEAGCADVAQHCEITGLPIFF